MEAKRKAVDPLEPGRHRCARVEMSSKGARDRGSTMNVTTYGLDVAKRVFQVRWVEPETGEVKRKTLARTEVSAFFARREPGVVAMEACGSAHHWGTRQSRDLRVQARSRGRPDCEGRCWAVV